MIVIVLLLASCSQADVASNNVSKAADNFEINRRIVFYNGITDNYILIIEGLCSLGNYDTAGELSVTCKTGPNEYKKHYLGRSDNVTYFAEQIDAVSVDVYYYYSFRQITQQIQCFNTSSKPQIPCPRNLLALY